MFVPVVFVQLHPYFLAYLLLLLLLLLLLKLKDRPTAYARECTVRVFLL